MFGKIYNPDIEMSKTRVVAEVLGLKSMPGKGQLPRDLIDSFPWQERITEKNNRTLVLSNKDIGILKGRFDLFVELKEEWLPIGKFAHNYLCLKIKPVEDWLKYGQVEMVIISIKDIEKIKRVLEDGKTLVVRIDNNNKTNRKHFFNPLALEVDGIKESILAEIKAVKRERGIVENELLREPLPKVEKDDNYDPEDDLEETTEKFFAKMKKKYLPPERNNEERICAGKVYDKIEKKQIPCVTVLRKDNKDKFCFACKRDQHLPIPEE